MAERFKKTFCVGNVRVHFVGAWYAIPYIALFSLTKATGINRDTVSSIGIVRGKRLLPETANGMKHTCYFRHALALDERRIKFLPEYANELTGPPAEETDSAGPKSDKRTRDEEVPKNSTSEDTTGIDEGMARGLTQKRPVHTKEVWFAGTHSDM